MNLKRISASCFCLLLAGQMTLSAQNVSFGSNKVTLKSAFEKIEQASKYKIAYNSDQLNANRVVTLSKTNGDALDLLKQILKQSDCTYELNGNYVIVKPLSKKHQAEAEGQHIKVMGNVTDQISVLLLIYNSCIDRVFQLCPHLIKCIAQFPDLFSTTVDHYLIVEISFLDTFCACF